jgi:hypothetical protein
MSADSRPATFRYVGGAVQIPARTLVPGEAREPAPSVAWEARAPVPVIITPAASTAEAATTARIRIVHPLP